MNETLIENFAQEITGIFREHNLKRITTAEIGALSIPEAYAVQDKFLAARIAAGERIIGYKVGCTSPAIQAQFGLSEPICGRVLAPHIYTDGERLKIHDFVNCALEPEFVLHIAFDLDGSNLGDSHLRSAIAAISPGIEIHNYRFWYGNPTSQELIASNGIHAGLVVGDKHELTPEIDLTQEHVTISIDHREIASGIGADIMGGPIDSLRWLLIHLQKEKRGLRKGDLVIPGSATKLVPVQAGDIAEASFTHFGSCRAVFD